MMSNKNALGGRVEDTKEERCEVSVVACECLALKKRLKVMEWVGWPIPGDLFISSIYKRVMMVRRRYLNRGSRLVIAVNQPSEPTNL